MANQEKTKLVSSKKLSVLITIVKKQKADYYLDLLEQFNVNMQLSMVGNGTTQSTVFTDEVGTKAVIFTFITDDKLPAAIKLLKEKFDEIRDGKGVCFSVPFSSVMGVTFFNFLSNNKGNLI
ncbi:MAG: hypothetical protein II411_01590 [Lachnospiraceae bacterium]|nr:hypothetical protein [Lachnospiraceae bacterium]